MVINVLIVSIFLVFISWIWVPLVAERSVNLDKACTNASLSNWSNIQKSCFNKVCEIRVKCVVVWNILLWLSGSDVKSVTYRHTKDTGYSDCTANAIQTQWCHRRVVVVLEIHTECCQKWTPSHLKWTGKVKTLCRKFKPRWKEDENCSMGIERLPKLRSESSNLAYSVF